METIERVLSLNASDAYVGGEHVVTRSVLSRSIELVDVEEV